jgi:sporulation protein YlmC with PRC-barrel domain
MTKFSVKGISERKEDTVMRKYTYMLIGLFTLSFLFAGSSFAGSGKMATCSDFSEAMGLLGTTLYDTTGVYIGEVDDLAINSSTGRIDSVLVNRIRGVGDRVVAIPFDHITKTGEYTYVYNPPQGGGWPFVVSYYDQLPYDAYGFNQLPSMGQGHHKFTELLASSVQSMEGEECPV